MMHATTLIVAEGEPAAWPDPPGDLSAEAVGIPQAVVWGRIEDWTRVRWGERNASFTVEAEGDACWRAPLEPFTPSATLQWDHEDETYLPVTLRGTPTGGLRLPAGFYQLDGLVGFSDAPPERVLEAYRRLAEFLAEAVRDPSKVGVSAHTIDIGGAISESSTRPASWLAKSIHLSGAADLLRPWRRLGAH
ncbi:MAG: hypothetical protein AAFP17_10395 [Pseudomonadota bacterium]